MFTRRPVVVLVLVAALLLACEALQPLGGRREMLRQQPQQQHTDAWGSLPGRSLQAHELPNALSLPSIDIVVRPQNWLQVNKYCPLCATKCHTCAHCHEAIAACPNNRNTASCVACAGCSSCPKTVGRHPSAYESCSSCFACAVCCPQAYFTCDACSFCQFCKHCPK